MSLTIAQKRTLDEQTRTIVANLNNGETRLDIDDLKTTLQVGSIISILASFRRIAADNNRAVIKYLNNSRKIRIFKGAILNLDRTTFTKDKNLLYFDCFEGLVYDFNTKTFNMNLSTLYYNDQFFDTGLLKMLEYEWLFNYVNDVCEIKSIQHNVAEEFYKTMPSGFYQVIQERGLSADTLKEFAYKKAYGKFCGVADYMHYYDDAFNALLSFIKDCNFDNYMKLIKNDILKFGIPHLSSSYQLRDFFETYQKAKAINADFTLNFDRDTETNLELMKATIDREKIRVLETQLQRLNFINNVQINNYTIVVPQTQAEKQDEGRQQHNCVGHYYDDSIVRGENLIYFIRKASKVDHSYITCRYNIKAKATVEARKVNNTSINNIAEEALIKQIDELINAGLAQKTE